jgi:flagellar biogenesis protein FliO
VKRLGMHGRIALLSCLLSWGLLSALQAQPQDPGVPPVPSASPATSPAPEGAATPAPISTPAATISPDSPAPVVASPTLRLPSEAEREAATEWKKKGPIGQSTFVDKLRTVTWSLAFVCFLVWLVGKVAGRATLEKFGLPVEPDSLIEVLEKKRISPGRSVMLLRVGPKVLAVAVTENGFRTLTEIDGEALRQYRDELPIVGSGEPADGAPPPATTPADIAKHYLSIIPGLGAKK